ncbi:hypothetical protein PIB30_072730 [Stylosanthes scabra]|uniref:GRF-type domain-containing protein n=1 Tax=Stylosanthes scabra TaxID=79078 RepID=A0ABU6VN52_9FABA|nr:hypothetical protein [Stylosanthes scabra]
MLDKRQRGSTKTTPCKEIPNSLIPNPRNWGIFPQRRSLFSAGLPCNHSETWRWMGCPLGPVAVGVAGEVKIFVIHPRFFRFEGVGERDGWCCPQMQLWLYLSKTTKNPNRLFFGCPLYKSSHNHCNFFLWLDRHLAMFGKKEQFKGVEDEEDVSEHFAKMKLELKLADLEERVSAIEKKKKRMHVPHCPGNCCFFAINLCKQGVRL